MSLLQEEDRLLIQDGVEKFIDDNYPFEEKEKREEQFGVFGGHWATFAELGWLALPFSEEVGGLGGGALDAQVLASAFGRGLIAEPFVDVVLLAGKAIEYCVPAALRDDMLAALVGGESSYILAHGESQADASFSGVGCVARAAGEGFELTGTKRMVFSAANADFFLVTALLDNSPALFLVSKNTNRLEMSAFPTIDSGSASDLHFDAVTVGKDALLASGEAVETGIKKAVLFAQAVLCGEAQGIATAARKMTAEYLNTREQFGTRIANFQALQHKLADMVIAEEEIKSVADLAANAFLLDDDKELEVTVRTAKARSAKVLREMIETAVQLHGGIGVTDELIVSHYLRRAVAIDAFYGDVQQQLIWLTRQY